MHPTLEVLLTENEVAKLLRVSVATIRRRRLFRQPPEWVKIGASVRYRPEAVQRLIESGTCSPVEQNAANKKAQRVRTSHSGARRDAC
jgi:predicted DNA-binding transcriptional regulator AlpA